MRIHHRDLWDTRYVRSKLAADSISETQSFAYFLSILCFDWLQLVSFRLSVTSCLLDSWQRADALFTFAISVFGVLFLFACNGGKRGKYFLYRYFPLSFVVGWKFMLLSVIGSWILPLYFSNASEIVIGWISFFTLAVLNLAMFLRIGFHLRELDRESRERNV